MVLSRRIRTAALAAGALTLTACSGSVLLPVGPYAPDPACGRIIQALPGELAGLPELRTTAQATIAWGEPGAAVTLRCGVEPPPPTDDRCIGVMGGDGVQVDWINPEPESDLQPETAQQEGGAWAFITYGRVPAVELVVPASVALEPAALLTAIGPAVAQAPAERHCLTFTDQTID